MPFPHSEKRHDVVSVWEGGGGEEQLKARWLSKICDRNATHRAYLGCSWFHSGPTVPLHELIHYSICLLGSTLRLTLSYELDKQSWIVPFPGWFSLLPFIILCKRRRAIVFLSPFLSHSHGRLFSKVPGNRCMKRPGRRDESHSHLKTHRGAVRVCNCPLQTLEIHLRFLGEAHYWLGESMAWVWWIPNVRLNSQSLPGLLP